MKLVFAVPLLLGLACCGCETKSGPDAEVEVDVDRPPDLDPATDDDVDIKVD